MLCGFYGTVPLMHVPGANPAAVYASYLQRLYSTFLALPEDLEAPLVLELLLHLVMLPLCRHGRMLDRCNGAQQQLDLFAAAEQF